MKVSKLMSHGLERPGQKDFKRSFKKERGGEGGGGLLSMIARSRRGAKSISLASSILTKEKKENLLFSNA